MPNPIKYTTGTETLALKKGNFYIGTGDVGKGPSDSTGYYQGISPSEGGYVIYMNREGAPGSLSYHNAPTDNDLITFTNNLAGQSYTTVQECLVYYASQSDKVVLNRDYEGIVTDGLVLNLDAGFTPSYPRSGTTWYDLSGTNNGTLTNGPTFSGDSIVFDGVDDYSIISNDTSLQFGETFSINCWVYPTDIRLRRVIFATRINNPNGSWQLELGEANSGNGRVAVTGVDTWIYESSNGVITTGKWYNICYVKQNNEDVGGTMYINNSTLTPLTTTSYSITNNTDNKTLGFGQPNTQYFKGNIPVVQIYNRALTQTEILQNYNAQKGRFGL